MRTPVKYNPSFKNGQKEWRFGGRRGVDLLRRSKNYIHGREAVGGKLPGAAKMKDGIATEVGDYEHIHVTARTVRAFGIGTEEDDALRRKGAHITGNDTTQKRRRLRSFFAKRPASHPAPPA